MSRVERGRFVDALALLASAAAILCWQGSAEARRIMVFGPHGDDALLIGAGVIKTAVQNLDQVAVVAVTDSAYNASGEIDPTQGRTRICEMVKALTDIAGSSAVMLNISQRDQGLIHPVFLGYPNGYVEQMFFSSPSPFPAVYAGTPTTGTQTYACGDFPIANYSPVPPPCSCGFIEDWGSQQPQSPQHSSNTRQNFDADIANVIEWFKPDAIYLPSNVDNHWEHTATYQSVQSALLARAAQGKYVPRVYEAAVHAADEARADPSSPTGWTGWPDDTFGKYTMPPYPYPVGVWDLRHSFDLPPSMTGNGGGKDVVLRDFAQEYNGDVPFFSHFRKQDEFFWSKENDIARTATWCTSNSFPTCGQDGAKAGDGIIDGSFSFSGYGQWQVGDPTREWLSNTTPAWIQATWPRKHTIDRVVLYDRIIATDNITSGTLTFDDQSTVTVGALSDVSGVVVRLSPPKSTTSIRFTANTSSGAHPGLAEFEAYESTNIAPKAISATASSSFSNGGVLMGPDKAIDGVVKGYTSTTPNDWVYEWASNGQLASAWIRLAWDHAYTVDRVVLYDRPNLADHITLGSLTLSDTNGVNYGFSVTALPDDAGSYVVSFPPISTAALTFTVGSANGANIGLSELEVHRARNIAPDSVATASSSFSNGGVLMGPDKAIDGVVKGYTNATQGDWVYEWASNGQLAGAWLRLDWATPTHAPPVTKRISRVVLFDRPNPSDNILQGNLVFGTANGTVTKSFGQISASGTAIVLNPPIDSESMKIQITQAAGANIGLAEVEVYEAE